MKNRIKKNMPPIIFITVLLLAWQIGASKMGAAYILPTPVQIIERLIELREPLFMIHLPATMKITVTGLAISIFLGVLFAVVMDLSSSVEKALYPVIVASQTIPVTALAPLFVLWFGYGVWSKILVCVLITFFPITITVYDGFKSTKREMEELILSYGGTKKDVFMKLKVPTAMPAFFSSIKMAIPISIIGAAIGEWLGAQQGLGYFSRRMMTQLDGAGVFAPVVLLSVVAMVLVFIVTVVEKIFIVWRKEL